MMNRSTISPSPIGTGNRRVYYQQNQVVDDFHQPYLVAPQVEDVTSSSMSSEYADGHMFDNMDDVDFTATIESSINEATRWLQQGSTFGGRPSLTMMNQGWDCNPQGDLQEGIDGFMSSVTPLENDDSFNNDDADEDFDFFVNQEFDDDISNGVHMHNGLPNKMNSVCGFSQESLGFPSIEKTTSTSPSSLAQSSGIPTVVSGELSSTSSTSPSSSQQNDGTTTITQSSSSTTTATVTANQQKQAQIRALLVQRHYRRLQLIRRQRMELRRQMLIARAKRQLRYRKHQQQQQRMMMIMALKQRRAHALASRIRNQHMMNMQQQNGISHVDCWDESFDHDLDEHNSGMYNNTLNTSYHQVQQQQHRDYPTEISVSINTTTDDSNTVSNNVCGSNGSVVDDGVSALTQPIELVGSTTSNVSPFRRAVSRSSSMNHIAGTTMNHSNNGYRMIQTNKNTSIDDKNNESASGTYHV
jgi:hypothetical protein